MSDDEELSSEFGDEMAFDDWKHPDVDDVGPMDERYLIDVHLPPVVEDLRAGETIEDRNARLLREADLEREADRPEGTKRNPPVDPLVALGFGSEPRIRGSAVKVIDKDGVETWRNLTYDEDATRAFIEARAEERGQTLSDLTKRFPPGRPKAKDRFRRKLLAEILDEVYAAGAKTGVVGKILGLDRRRIAELRSSS